MSTTAIQARSLGKVYRLFRRPADRVLDAFGFGGWGRRARQEFWALRGIDLTVARGERLGVVGSNGAGKSTLLKLITGNVRPSEGEVEIHGAIQALMQLGTGFHPEFTGRRNIRAALAYQGFSASEISAKEGEIIDFAELESFIDQPVRTYSAGMYARLAFSAATAVEPEILIIDEVLGAGDAYFASKSIDRMKRLTRRSGTTVLFVSHDMSSVESLCDRAIWLERGRLCDDGETHDVSKAYAQVVRQRGERRLRRRNAMANRATGQQPDASRTEHLQLVLRFLHRAGEPLDIRRVALKGPSVPSCEIRVGDAQDCTDEEAFVLIDHQQSFWGEPRRGRDGRLSRSITNHTDAHSAVVFHVDTLAEGDELDVEVEWQASSKTRAQVEVYDGAQFWPLANLALSGNTAADQWHRWRAKISPEVTRGLLRSFDAPSGRESLQNEEGGERTSAGNGVSIAGSTAAVVDLQEVAPVDPTRRDSQTSERAEIYGGQVRIERVWFADAGGNETCSVTSLQCLDVCIDYVAHCGPLPVEFAVTIHREGVIALQALSGLDTQSRRTLEAGEQGRCTLRIPRLPLGQGRYFVTIGIFPPLDYNSKDTERTAYVLHDRRYEIEVRQEEDILIDLGMCRGDVSWDVAGRAA